MFQDWEGIPSQFACESSVDWDFIAAYRQEEGQDEAFIAWAEYNGECDYEKFVDAFLGAAPSDEEYAHEYVIEHDLLSSVPENLRCYFDYEAYAHDLFSGGLVFVDGYVFSN